MSKTTNRQRRNGATRPGFGSLNNLRAYGLKTLRACPAASACSVECRLAGEERTVWIDRAGTVTVATA